MLLTYWLLIKFPMTLASGLVNFLELVTELRKTVHLLDDWFIRRDNSGRARWKRRREQGIRGRAWSFLPPLGAPPSQPLNVFCNPETLRDVDGGFILKAQLIKSLAIDIKFTLAPPPLEVGGGAGSSSPINTWLIFLVTSPPHEAL